VASGNVLQLALANCETQKYNWYVWFPVVASRQMQKDLKDRGIGRSLTWRFSPKIKLLKKSKHPLAGMHAGLKQFRPV
jgi:hypothetical protein